MHFVTIAPTLQVLLEHFSVRYEDGVDNSDRSEMASYFCYSLFNTVYVVFDLQSKEVLGYTGLLAPLRILLVFTPDLLRYTFFLTPEIKQ